MESIILPRSLFLVSDVYYFHLRINILFIFNQAGVIIYCGITCTVVLLKSYGLKIKTEMTDRETNINEVAKSITGSCG